MEDKVSEWVDIALAEWLELHLEGGDEPAVITSIKSGVAADTWVLVDADGSEWLLALEKRA